MHLEAVLEYDSTVDSESTVYMLARRTAEYMDLETALEINARFKSERYEHDSDRVSLMRKVVNRQPSKRFREITHGLVRGFRRSYRVSR